MRRSRTAGNNKVEGKALTDYPRGRAFGFSRPVPSLPSARCYFTSLQEAPRAPRYRSRPTPSFVLLPSRAELKWLVSTIEKLDGCETQVTVADISRS